MYASTSRSAIRVSFDDPRRIESIIQTPQSTAEWLQLLADNGVPASAVNTLEDLLTDRHLLATGFWKQIEHPSEGTLLLTGFPAGFSATPADVARRHAPRLGEHTAEVLREAGLEESTIAALVTAAAAAQAAPSSEENS